MTSPTKNKSSKDNPDMLVLKELNVELYQNLIITLDYLQNADIKKFIDNPGDLSKLLLSRSVIEEIDKFSLTTKAEKIAASLRQWQTELIFHYNRLIPQVKSQPYSIIIKFLQMNFAVDLMQPIPLTPLKSARLQARGKGSSPNNEAEAVHNVVELPHHKSTVAKKLIFDVNVSVKAEPGIPQNPKTSPRI